MLTNILSSLGFTEEEIKTYLLLLEVGSITAGELAKKLGIPRSSLYGFLKRLQDKGLVTQSMKWEVKTFSAEPPEKIIFLFQQRIEDLQEKRTLFDELLPELKKHKPSTFIIPKFHLYEGEEGVRHVLKDMLLYNDMETRALWPIRDMVEILSPDFFRYLNKVRIRNNLYTRAIWPKDKVVDIKKHPYLGVGEEFKREIRVAPKGVTFSMGYWTYANKAAFISSRKESFGFIIESAELVEMLLTQFEVLWKVSKPINVDERYTDPFLKEIAYRGV